ncbi:thiamine phosphate synthase [Novipirellula artificiosorum]|uniref:Thiamine-phosphate synthase n=1 Tax=Novipirellula artificiosorum TaxID=2528016 RepID=A0A5C6DN81_9BACT|nr:thiamine phosphate synthase [Novipirellula artificiosorum]TWU37317.1 Thiamine-phosphate synthase [Novipirellula artificiosorum]
MTLPSNRSTHRILDASINRATEGIRTLEEFARFELQDPTIFEPLKSLRHDLSNAVDQHLSRESLLSARDTPGDLGTKIEAATEYDRPSKRVVVVAASARVQQSLRVIEEYGKTLNADFGRRVEQLRYRAYQLCAQQELQVLHHRRRRLLSKSQLYYLIDAGSSEPAFLNAIKTLSAAGVDVFQLRDKDIDDSTLYQRARVGAAIARELDRLFIVNDRCDIAVAADADGVHLGQDELPASVARTIIGDNRLLGVSTHSLPQVKRAELDGADYIGCGPVFRSRTKTFSEFAGTDFLSEVSLATPMPAFAIGGIERNNLSKVIETGFTRIAVTGAIRDAEDPLTAAAELREQLGSLG